MPVSSLGGFGSPRTLEANLRGARVSEAELGGRRFARVDDLGLEQQPDKKAENAANERSAERYEHIGDDATAFGLDPDVRVVVHP